MSTFSVSYLSELFHWYKITELRKLLSGFGCKLIQNHLKHPEENAHLERSHRTDDDEFYIPRILHITNRQEMFTEAFNYMYYYNAVRKHSGINRETPVQCLFKQEPQLDARIKFVPPLILDNLSVRLGTWSGYHLLAHHQMKLSIESFQYEFLIKILSLIGKRQMDAHAIQHPVRKNQFPQIRRVFKQYSVAAMEVCDHQVLTFSPQKASSNTHLIYFHGGAYVWQGDFIHWKFLRKLIRYLGCRASYVDYPLAPEHGCAETMSMVQKSYENLVKNYPADEFVFIGDSAGAALALALAQKLHREKFPKQPQKMILISPWLDLTLANPQIEQLAAQDPLLSVKALSLAADLYARGENKSGYLLSPINGEVTDLGEIYIFTGTRDILWPDCRRFYAMAKKAHHNIFMYEYENMPHVWIFFPFRQTKETISRIIEILEK